SEQEERLLARQQEPEKAWKLSVSDWEDRGDWDRYLQAYEDALQRCSEAAPWHIVPANKKWFRNLAVASVLAETLRPYAQGWRAALDQKRRLRLDELKRYRQRK
ncbi:MAG: polyphosphate kinase 2 family protein, partial [Dehalococcoidia bacterium]